MPSYDEIITGLLRLGNLKTTPRRGWQLAGLMHVESVADHSWRVAVIASLLCDQPQQAAWTALWHDAAEAITGDVAPADGVPSHAKQQAEAQAMEQLLAPFVATPSMRDAASSAHAAWQGYTRKQGHVAAAVKDADMLDMALQALSYEQQHGVQLSSFFEGLADKLSLPASASMLAAIQARRQGTAPSQPAPLFQQPQPSRARSTPRHREPAADELTPSSQDQGDHQVRHSALYPHDHSDLRAQLILVPLLVALAAIIMHIPAHWLSDHAFVS